ncbi:MAG: type IX secretion system protein PorQ [Dysgonamonadaceae bacterium]|nr:type IX secretion system protein PorQ [Dysgonamonadaceae bacterium]
MRRLFLIFLLSIASLSLQAQGGRTTFDYLLLPHSARSSALGGTNVSVVENDASLIYDNPAFLGSEMDKTLLVSYLSYIADIGMGHITFTKKLSEATSFGIGALYANYGKMIETTDDNRIAGDLQASDICGSIFVAHDLTERLRGGITGKFLYSNYYHNTAIGLGVDLGLSYCNEENTFSWGLTGKNIGRQIKAYDEEPAALPWDIQFGITRKLSRAPIRFSLIATHLKRWKFDDVYASGDSFVKTLGKHLIVGVELIPNDNFWIGIGYNIKRATDMHLENGNKFGGFSAGAGVRIQTFNVGCSIGKYNTAATSFMISLATTFATKEI